MKVITFQELCALPEGAIFSVFPPHSREAQGLYRRGKALKCGKDLEAYYRGEHSDFYYHDLVGTAKDSHHCEIEDTKFGDLLDGGRWGNLDPDEMFVLYDPDDVRKLTHLLTGEPYVPCDPVLPALQG